MHKDRQRGVSTKLALSYSGQSIRYVGRGYMRVTCLADGIRIRIEKYCEVTLCNQLRRNYSVGNAIVSSRVILRLKLPLLILRKSQIICPPHLTDWGKKHLRREGSSSQATAFHEEPTGLPHTS